jgi:pimeloyl-ACP methyl ester carboxylesterase
VAFVASCEPRFLRPLYLLEARLTRTRLAIIDGADHALIWARPEDLVRVVDEFLEPS